MKILKNAVLIAVISGSLILPAAISAHGTGFHSLAELARHIDGHLTELQSLENQNPPDALKIKEECDEIAMHAQQYKHLALELMAKHQNVAVASRLGEISDRIMEAARRFDFPGTIHLMREMRALLRQEVL